MTTTTECRGSGMPPVKRASMNKGWCSRCKSWAPLVEDNKLDIHYVLDPTPDLIPDLMDALDSSIKAARQTAKSMRADPTPTDPCQGSAKPAQTSDLPPLERAVRFINDACEKDTGVWPLSTGHIAVVSLATLRLLDPEAFAAIQVRIGMEGQAVLQGRVVEMEPWHAWHNSLGYYHAKPGAPPPPLPPNCGPAPGPSIPLYRPKQHTDSEGSTT